MKNKSVYSIFAFALIVNFSCNSHLVKCPDGTKVLVHKNPEKAYPVIARNYNLALKNSFELSNSLYDSTSLEYKNTVLELREKASQEVIKDENLLKLIYMNSNNRPCDTIIRNAYIKATNDIINKMYELRKINSQLKELSDNSHMSKLQKQSKSDSLLKEIIKITSKKINLNLLEDNSSQSLSNKPEIELSALHFGPIKDLLYVNSKIGKSDTEDLFNYIDSNSIHLERLSPSEFKLLATLYPTFFDKSFFLRGLNLILYTSNNLWQPISQIVIDKDNSIDSIILNKVNKITFEISIINLDPGISYTLDMSLLFYYLNNKEQGFGTTSHRVNLF